MLLTKKLTKLYLMLSGVMILCICHKAQCETVTISHSTADIDDTVIFSNHPLDNSGATLETRAGRTGQNSSAVHRLLIRFNLSSIPSNATISAVTVVLDCIRVPDEDLDMVGVNHELHRLTKSWIEGNGIANKGKGGQNINSAACWNYSRYSTTLWKTPGGDFIVTPSASTNIGLTAGLKIWTGKGLVSDVQSWVSGKQPNDGWIVLGDESTPRSIRNYASSEDIQHSPSLTVVYSVPKTKKQK